MTRPEIQTCIDECVGGWQGTIFLGSNLYVPPGSEHAYFHGATFEEVASQIWQVIREMDQEARA